MHGQTSKINICSEQAWKDLEVNHIGAIQSFRGVLFSPRENFILGSAYIFWKNYAGKNSKYCTEDLLLFWSTYGEMVDLEQSLMAEIMRLQGYMGEFH